MRRLLVLGFFILSALANHQASGENFRDKCASGSFLVGFLVRSGAWVDGITAFCARV